jgi:hypothetical protein
MAPSYKFAILRAAPDPRRGERVNIGVVVFRAGALDIRFAELQKLRALTGRDWDGYVQSYRAHAGRVVGSYHQDDERLAALASFEKVISPTDFGWLEASTEEYEVRINEILNSFVNRTVLERKIREPRINTEIAVEFRKHKILAKSSDDLLSHKVVRNVDFHRHKGLRADFVLKNGVYHVTATLDLRKTSVKIDEACLKAVVLDKAKEEFDGDKRLFGVYAAPLAETINFKDHIELLGDYADELFNWMDLSARSNYQRRMYDALTRVFDSK